jgi:hypothetical protein
MAGAAMNLTVEDTKVLAASWQLALRAERKSPQRLKACGDGLRQYLTWCAKHDAAPMTHAPTPCPA